MLGDLWGGGFAVSPAKPRVPHCEERPGAAHSTRDQMCVGVGGEPGKIAPTHPPSAVVSYGRVAVRDASAIPQGGVRQVKGIHCLATCFFRISLLFFAVLRQGDGFGSDPGGAVSHLDIKLLVSSGSVTLNITQHAATLHAVLRKEHTHTRDCWSDVTMVAEYVMNVFIPLIMEYIIEVIKVVLRERISERIC